jgi:hypothetical protein
VRKINGKIELTFQLAKVETQSTSDTAQLVTKFAVRAVCERQRISGYGGGQAAPESIHRRASRIKAS